MTKYKKTKQQRKLEKNNLIKAYASLNERGCISNAEFKKSEGV
jgi:hypothetical protein